MIIHLLYQNSILMETKSFYSLEALLTHLVNKSQVQKWSLWTTLSMQWQEEKELIQTTLNHVLKSVENLMKNVVQQLWSLIQSKNLISHTTASTTILAWMNQELLILVNIISRYNVRIIHGLVPSISLSNI